ncbi:MAG: 6-carboxytetrahydropterin synthase QueD [Zoogloeaceae bacterium]|jgi:6-pyruvoyltetrahydropterin/6-carboxytetrahydropterin synthase|nr:6-carboxytetrahydropterin synthase QueD [Zoogloeaceae bacterium]
MRVTRRLEFDAGHRIPDHNSQCRNLHGHRYALEITLAGDLVETPGDAARGMVLDFSDVKAIAREELVDAWDHAFLVCADDAPIVGFLQSLPGHKTVLLDCVPTAENLARIAFSRLARAYQTKFGGRLRLDSVRLYETPHCWADVRAEDMLCPAA